jgi:hypothetical protein
MMTYLLSTPCLDTTHLIPRFITISELHWVNTFRILFQGLINWSHYKFHCLIIIRINPIYKFYSIKRLIYIRPVAPPWTSLHLCVRHWCWEWEKRKTSSSPLSSLFYCLLFIQFEGEHDNNRINKKCCYLLSLFVS